MDGLDAAVKVLTVLPLLLKAGSMLRLHGKSGKRIHYVVWKEGPTSPVNPRLRKWLSFLVPRGRKAVGESTLTAQMFLWNGGSEDIVSADFFRDHPICIDLFDGEITSYRVVLETDDLVGSGGELAPRVSENTFRTQSKRVLVLRMEYWPPGAGVIVELKYRTQSIKASRFVLAGPIRGLRERRSLGTLWRINLKGFPHLSRELTTSTALTWTAWIGFTTSIAALLFHLTTWKVNTWQYWSMVSVCLFFEGAVFSYNEKQKQLSKKVCPSLIYWLNTPKTTPPT